VERFFTPIGWKTAPLELIQAFADRQHGLVARWQLVKAGLEGWEVDNLVDAERLLRVHRGVYGAGHRPRGPRSREMAVVLLAGAEGALAQQSSAALWAITRPWHGPVHVLGPRSRKGDGFVIHRARDLPDDDVTVHWGIPTTTPLRTLLDLSRTLSLDALDAALSEALVRRLVALEDVRARARGKLRKLVGTAAPTRSKLERDFRALLREHGLPQPTSNGFVEGIEVDLHWPEHRLIVEIDGYGTHDHRRAFETDRVRDQRLLVAGWRVARVTDWQMDELRAETAGRFAALLSRRAC